MLGCSSSDYSIDAALFNIGKVGKSERLPVFRRDDVVPIVVHNVLIVTSGFNFVESFAFGFAEPPVVVCRAKPDRLLELDFVEFVAFGLRPIRPSSHVG
jgi:hypothetical protein